MIDQIKKMTNDDDEKIKIIFNTLRIKVFLWNGEIADLDLAQIKINKNTICNKQMNEKYRIISKKVYTCNMNLSTLNLCKNN